MNKWIAIVSMLLISCDIKVLPPDHTEIDSVAQNWATQWGLHPQMVSCKQDWGTGYFCTVQTHQNNDVKLYLIHCNLLGDQSHCELRNN